ncbi:MAG TPA: peptidoglycan DD-metalloendopeptidase family protein [Paralcaligenes sp.]
MFKKGTTDTPYSTHLFRARNHTPVFIRNGLVLVALGLSAAAALAMVTPPQDATPTLAYTVRQTLSLPGQTPELADRYSKPFISETQIRSGDVLAAVIQRLGIREPELQQFLVNNKEARSIYKLYPGRTVLAALDQNGQLVWLRYNHTPGQYQQGEYVSKWLEVRPDGQGSFTAQEHSQAASMHVRIAEGEIDSSLFGAADEANIPDAITQQMTDILGSKIDFMKDLRQGDRFRIVYESYSHAGKTVGAGRILALEFINGDHAYEAVWFDQNGDNRPGSYYDFSGHNLKGAFLRTALAFTRISSTFGRRLHPLHGTWKSHDGVDYAAPRGTPIHATADGTVEFIGKQSGYGNVIILAHGGHYETLYAHQQAFAKGLKKGATVAQGDVIGYVGATGWATGPHLHYEFRVDEKPVNPLSIDLPVAQALDQRQLPLFERAVAQYKDHIRLLAQLQSQDVQLANL